MTSTNAATSGIVVWSSTHQATTVNGRPFEAELAKRAQFRERSFNDGNQMLGKAKDNLLKPSGPKGILAGALFATAGVGMTALGAATDARADVRYVKTLPERAALFIDVNE